MRPAFPEAAKKGNREILLWHFKSLSRKIKNFEQAVFFHLSDVFQCKLFLLKNSRRKKVKAMSPLLQCGLGLTHFSVFSCQKFGNIRLFQNSQELNRKIWFQIFQPRSGCQKWGEEHVSAEGFKSVEILVYGSLLTNHESSISLLICI